MCRVEKGGGWILIPRGWPSFQLNLRSGRFVSRIRIGARRRKSIRFSRVLNVENGLAVSGGWEGEGKVGCVTIGEPWLEKGSRERRIGSRANEKSASGYYSPGKLKISPSISLSFFGRYEFILSLPLFLCFFFLFFISPPILPFSFFPPFERFHEFDKQAEVDLKHVFVYFIYFARCEGIAIESGLTQCWPRDHV